MRIHNKNTACLFIQLHWVKRLLFSIFFFLSFSAPAQNKYWTDFSNINDSLRAKPKPLMVFIHTDWCKYCKIQEETSFADTILLKALSKQYYCLKLNAESKENIHLLNYQFQSNSVDYHTLALSIGTTDDSKELILPTTVFLEPTLSVVYKNRGLMTKEQFKKLLEKSNKD